MRSTRVAARALIPNAFGQGASLGDIGDLVKLTELPGHLPANEKLKKWVFEEKPQVSDVATVAVLRENLLFDATKDPVVEAQRLAAEGWEVGSRTITYVLSVLKKTNRMDEANVLCDRIVARKPDWLNSRTSHAGQTIGMIYARAGRTDALRNLLAVLRSPAVHLMTEIGIALAEAGAPVTPLITKMQEKGVRADEVMYRAIISRHVIQEERQALRQLMRRQRVKVTSPLFHALLMKEAAKRGDVEAAEEGFGFLTQYHKSIDNVTAKEWTMLCHAYGTAGDLPGMRRIDRRFESMNPALYEQTRSGSLRYISVLLSGYKRFVASHGQSLPGDQKETILRDAHALYDSATVHPDFRGEAKIFVTAMVGVLAGCGRRQEAARFATSASEAYNLKRSRELNLRAIAKAA